jgi:hypothetical protein
VIARDWPDWVEPSDFATLGGWPAAIDARRALLQTLDLRELV